MGSPMSSTVEATFAGATESIRDARLFVREQIAASSVGGERSSDMELAVSELVTNAIEHAHDDSITVAVETHPVSVTVSVSSSYSGSDLADPTTWSGPVPTMRSGRGLAIVRAVSDEVVVMASDDILTVTCTFRRP